MHTFAVDAGAPYTLQPLADAFGSEPAGVKLALLTAAAKLFFSRPPEAQKLLGACIAAGLNDGDQDVHDRALLYYRCAWGCAWCHLCLHAVGRDTCGKTALDRLATGLHLLDLSTTCPELSSRVCVAAVSVLPGCAWPGAAQVQVLCMPASVGPVYRTLLPAWPCCHHLAGC